MNAKDVLKATLAETSFILNTYLSDLSDADLSQRPVPEANSLAWQLGHLISSEIGLLKEHISTYPPLPAGWEEAHPRKATSPAPVKWTKAEYLDLFSKVRQATVSAVEGLSEADLDKPTTGPLAKFAPTLGRMLVLVSNHTLMHAGQFAVLRRKLGKPVLI